MISWLVLLYLWHGWAWELDWAPANPSSRRLSHLSLVTSLETSAGPKTGWSNTWRWLFSVGMHYYLIFMCWGHWVDRKSHGREMIGHINFTEFRTPVWYWTFALLSLKSLAAAQSAQMVSVPSHSCADGGLKTCLSCRWRWAAAAWTVLLQGLSRIDCIDSGAAIGVSYPLLIL